MSLHEHSRLSRRALLARAAGTVAVATLPPRSFAQTPATRPAIGGPRAPAGRASLLAGEDRADNVFKALKLIEDDVRAGLAAKQRIVIKPNMVLIDRQLSATHAQCIEGILEFLKPIWNGEILIGDSPASGRSTDGFANYGYDKLAGRYPNARLVDLDDQPHEYRPVLDHRCRPVATRFSKVLLDPDAYIISAAVPKTHDRAVITLSLKNVVVGAAVKDRSYHWGPNSKGRNDKILVHGGPHNEAIHINLFNMAQVIRPHLAVLDGYQAMEHNGPVNGTPVDHRIAIASTDFVAADRVACELMGFDFQRVGYLRFCAEAGLGQGDLKHVELLGEKLAPHIRKYRPHDSVEEQYKWEQRMLTIPA